MQAFADVFAIWGHLGVMSRELDIKYASVCNWHLRGVIPPEHWPIVIKGAKRRGRRVTSDMLLKLLVAHKKKTLEEKTSV